MKISLEVLYLLSYDAAMEILSDPVKRRAFDSVDPTFDNMVPSKAEGKEKFFEVFAPVFERNSRYASHMTDSDDSGSELEITLLYFSHSDGLLKNTSRVWEPRTRLLKRWIISIPFGK